MNFKKDLVTLLVHNQDELFLEDRVVQMIKPFREIWKNTYALSLPHVQADCQTSLSVPCGQLYV